MTESDKFPARPEAILVAMDFSAPARRALDTALAWHPGAEVTVLHVIDTELAARIDAANIAVEPVVLAKLRSQAEQGLANLQEEKRPAPFDTMTVEGIPFVEIVKIARDLDVDAVFMGMHAADRRIGEILAGGTAEMVLRASHCPVVCVP